MLARFVVQRWRVQWFRTEVQAGAPEPDVAASNLLSLAIRAHLLIDMPGNVSCRVRAPAGDARLHMLVTPRKVDKSRLSGADLVAAAVDVPARCVQCVTRCVDHKSSIDTGMQATLYRQLDGARAFLHFHYHARLLVVADAVTEFPYPCGCCEEAAAVLACLPPNSAAPLMVELIAHGYLLCLDDAAAQQLPALFDAASARLRAIVGDDPATLLYPIFVGPELAGVLACPAAAQAHVLTLRRHVQAVERLLAERAALLPVNLGVTTVDGLLQ